MELRQYALLLRKWLWLVVICTVVAGGTAYGVSKNSTPIYQASATLLVNQASNPVSGAGYQDILTSERLAKTYASLLTGWPMLDETARRLGVDAKDLEKTVTVSSVRDTQLLEIQVEGPNPQLIVQIANTLPEVFIAQNQELQMGRVSESKASLEREITSVEADITRTQDALNAVTDDNQRMRLETSLAQYRSTYSSLLSSYQQIRLAEAQATDNVAIAKPARVPELPIRPRTMTNTLLAAVVGAMIAVGAAFLIEYLDDTIKTPDDVARVSGLSTLGAIARLKETGGTRQLVAWLQTKAPESEAYRTLRTNIQFSSVDKPVRSLLVTSAGPSEGKSTTAANLAVVMAQTGQRVVLVDTDLRRPVMHKVFGVANNTGLTSALLNGEQVVLDGHLQGTEVENLSLLTSGPIPPNPSELLGSHRMARLVEKLAGQADLVIFDSPPVLAVTDAAVMGRQVDGVVLVVDAGQTREQVLAQAAAELQQTGANLLGVVLNRLDSRRGGYYYYYYYYSEEEGGQRRRSISPHGADEEGAPARGRARFPWPRLRA
ncbi:MAG: hypothetical protein AUK03_15860 [Anaerolineae bacterium CG2_30_64_16]|nr:MAG: hypothetical protein AUK03_15860 [Anaerolineae bacterium CG2_30_64_16]